MSELYDYFGSETSVQLTIINTPIPEREIGRKRFFEKSDPRVDEYVEAVSYTHLGSSPSSTSVAPS